MHRTDRRVGRPSEVCGVGVASLLALLPGCTLANAIDVCERSAPPTRDVNVVTSGAQVTFGPRSLAVLPTGGQLAAWITRVGVDAEESDELVVGRLDAVGARSVTCDDDREHVVWSEADEGSAFVVAGAELALARPSEQAVIVWTARPATGAPSVRVSTLDPARGCASAGARPPVVLSDEPLGGSPGGPSVAALDASRFVVLWPSSAGGAAALAARAFTVAPNGVVRFDPLRDYDTGEVTEARPVPVDGLFGVAARVRLLALDDERLLLTAILLRGLSFEPIAAVLASADLSLVVPPRAIGEPFPSLAPGSSLDVAFDGSQLLVVWSELDAEGAARTLGRFLTPSLDPLRSGAAPGAEPFRVASDPLGREVTPGVAARPGGGFYVAYGIESASAAASETGRAIALAAFDPEGERQFLNAACARADILASDREGRASAPSLAITPEGGLAMLWTAQGPTNADVDETGVLGRLLPARSLVPSP